MKSMRHALDAFISGSMSHPIEDEQSHSVFIAHNIIVKTIIFSVGELDGGNNEFAFLSARIIDEIPVRIEGVTSCLLSSS